MRHSRHAMKRPEQAGRSSIRFHLLFGFLGFLSLLWLLVRSGFKPSRLRYPCQQAALSALLGSLSYWGGVIGLSVLAARLHGRVRRLCPEGGSRRRGGLFLSALGAAAGFAGLALYVAVGRFPDPVGAATQIEIPSWISPTATSDVFVIRDVPVPAYSLDEGVLPSGVDVEAVFRDAGIDTLIDLMADQGTFFYRTAAHPSGLFGADDVVVIKINNQWSSGSTQRYNHTRIDLVKGLIYRLVEHPEGFTGAVVIGENTQNTRSDFDNEDYNNAEDPLTSYQDVVDAFVSQGYAVATSYWDSLGTAFVGEFSEGNLEDGYVTGPAPGGLGTHELSWPKFSLEVGTTTYRISMKNGLWNGTEYEPDRLKLINFPVMKAHGMAGSTLALKNYIGFLTIGNGDPLFSDWDQMHGYFWGYSGMHTGYGLLARQIARVRRADLDILDGIWVNPLGNTDDSDSCLREDLMLASRDPVALDYYASARILAQVAAYPYEVSAATPQGGTFRNFMLCTENRLRSEGVADVIDLDDSHSQAQEEAQFNVHVRSAESLPGSTPTPTSSPTTPEATATPSVGPSLAPTAPDPQADLSGDLWVDGNDLLILLRNWHHQVLAP